MQQQRTILLAEPDSRLRMKILLVSRHDSERDREWALAAGADACLVKPVRLGRMLQIAARLATSRNQSRGEVRAAQRISHDHQNKTHQTAETPGADE